MPGEYFASKVYFYVLRRAVVELTFWEGRVLQLYQGIYGARFSFNKGRPLY